MVERFGIFAPGKEGEDFKRKLPEKKRKEDAKSTKNAEIITINGEEIDKNDIIINQEQLTKEIVEDMKMKVGEIFDKNTSMGDLDRLVELVDYNLTQVKKGSSFETELRDEFSILEIGKRILSGGGSLEVAGRLMSPGAAEYLNELYLENKKAKRIPVGDGGEEKKAEVESKINSVLENYRIISDADHGKVGHIDKKIKMFSEGVA